MPPPDELGAVSATATEISLRDHLGRQTRLADFRGHNLVVYFYPMDDTPGCTVEGREFRDLFEQFAEQDCVIVGVSTDGVESHAKFVEKHAFPFILLADTEGELARAFGVLKGKIAARSTFVFDREQRIRRAFHDVTPRGHAQQVLNFVRSLLEGHRMLGG